ncbi:uncharacterized protein CIMG_08782 [Coccidioides immitis RS]|uniref:Uncharacterized protein n=1 Tax=Coccidioides immitis (strain RS) TaxID=246410 RepID=J3K668_COCIM|nr:uncharacterized protein CIMG_08782 [Coccidioides immitis RS]EAS30036.3 hypothetical protein CIMG_08782 [Coccidioides immitis RS]
MDLATQSAYSTSESESSCQDRGVTDHERARNHVSDDSRPSCAPRVAGPVTPPARTFLESEGSTPVSDSLAQSLLENRRRGIYFHRPPVLMLGGTGGDGAGLSRSDDIGLRYPSGDGVVGRTDLEEGLAEPSNELPDSPRLALPNFPADTISPMAVSEQQGVSAVATNSPETSIGVSLASHVAIHQNSVHGSSTDSINLPNSDQIQPEKMSGQPRKRNTGNSSPLARHRQAVDSGSGNGGLCPQCMHNLAASRDPPQETVPPVVQEELLWDTERLVGMRYLESYRDIRASPGSRNGFAIRSGCRVICIGDTVPCKDDESREDSFKIAFGDVYLVLRLYPDLWASCIRIDTSTPVYPFTPRSGFKPRYATTTWPTSTNAIKFLPLCCVTIEANFSKYIRCHPMYGNGSQAITNPSTGQVVIPPKRKESLAAGNDVLHRNGGILIPLDYYSQLNYPIMSRDAPYRVADPREKGDPVGHVCESMPVYYEPNLPNAFPVKISKMQWLRKKFLRQRQQAESQTKFLPPTPHAKDRAEGAGLIQTRHPGDKSSIQARNAEILNKLTQGGAQILKIVPGSKQVLGTAVSEPSPTSFRPLVDRMSRSRSGSRFGSALGTRSLTRSNSAK